MSRTTTKRRRRNTGGQIKQRLIRLWGIFIGIIVLMLVLGRSVYQSSNTLADIFQPSSSHTSYLTLETDQIFLYKEMPMNSSEFRKALLREVVKTGQTEGFMLDITVCHGADMTDLRYATELARQLDINIVLHRE